MDRYAFLLQENTEGANAAVIVPSVKDSGELSVLVVPKYAHGHKEVMLFFPGGKVEPGESPIAAAERELYQETNQYCKKYTELHHIHKFEGHVKFWFLGLECSNASFPHRPMDESLRGKPVWYSAEALFVPGKYATRLHPDHWDTLKVTLGYLANRDVFGTYAQDILLKTPATRELALKEGFLSPDIVASRHV